MHRHICSYTVAIVHVKVHMYVCICTCVPDVVHVCMFFSSVHVHMYESYTTLIANIVSLIVS